MVMLDTEVMEIRKILEMLKTEIKETQQAGLLTQSVAKDTSAKLSQIEESLPLEGSGATYVRWGKTSCPGNGSELVYKGFGGGSHYSDKGAGSAHLCLTEEPTWKVYDDAENSGATVWGLEYEFSNSKARKLFGKKPTRPRRSVLCLPHQESEFCNDSRKGYSRKQHEVTLRDIQSRLSRIEDNKASRGTLGSTYIRWGKTSCPGNGSELVYKGFAAGSKYDIKGAASTYLCLPEEPTWNVYDDSAQDSGTVWGAEYEFLYRDQQKFFGQDLGQRDAPCCVCYTNRASVLMIPGRNICYPGWTLEYHWYLVGGHDTHHATEFVCLDEKPEALVGGAKSEDGKLFYFTEARCDPLRCPPYVHGRELTCAMCSK